MAVAMILEWPDVSLKDYDAVWEELGLDDHPGEGGLVHSCGPNNGGIRVVDVWESEQAFQTFLAQRLGPVLAARGLGQPRSTVYPVHNLQLIGPATPDGDGIGELFGRFATAWNHGDPDGTAGTYVEDGCLIDPFGGVHRGRAAIRTAFAEILGGPLSDTTTTFDIDTVRPLCDGAALVDAVQHVTGGDELTFHVAAVVRRTGRGWWFVDGRPYAFVPPPV